MRQDDAASATVLPNLPLWKARDRSDRDDALMVLTRLWSETDYREAIAEAFGKAESPEPHLWLAHVLATSIWVS